MTFQIGDRIICIHKGYSKIKYGQTYVVSNVDDDIINIEGLPSYYVQCDFELEHVFNSPLNKVLR